MLLLKYVFVLLHIITAAAWFGLALPVARRARTVAEGRAPRLAEEGARTAKQLVVFSVLTLVFALGAFLTGGGFAGYGPAYHTSLLLILGIIGVSAALIRPGWTALEGGDAAAAKRVAMGVGIGHALWLVILVLMYWDTLGVAFTAL